MGAAPETDVATRSSVRPIAGPRDLLSLHLARPDRYPYFLESAADGTEQGRYDILFGFPGDVIRLGPDGRLSGAGGEHDFLTALDRAWRAVAAEPPTERPAAPFVGGWFLYLGYELAGQVEPVLELAYPDAEPIAVAARVPAAFVHDRATGRFYAVCEAGRPELLEAMLKDAARTGALPEEDPFRLASPLSEEEPERYLTAVERTRRYIRDGDVFQANLSRAWETRLTRSVQPGHLHRRLRAANPAPFAGLAVFDDLAIVSSSPERLLRLDRDFAETRPIAGTRPRARDSDRDAAYSEELIAHPKERAEHVMLIDLERNDLGRVCLPGSMQVDELMVIESYAHVHHIVSNVRGRLRPGVGPGQAVKAVFPGGTITGCPKVRCMQIIAELEGGPRGAYTGSMGYLSLDGRLDLNILIRTLTLKGESLSFRAGAGIVADSVPERELEETRHKARGLVRALGLPG